MKRIKIFRSDGASVDLPELLKVLKDAGCEFETEPQEDELTFECDFDVELNEDVLIILLTSDEDVSDACEGLIQSTVSSGGRVIGMWVPGETSLELHSAVEKVGWSQVSWGSDQLRAVICGEVQVFENPEGAGTKPLKTPVNICR